MEPKGIKDVYDVNDTLVRTLEKKDQIREVSKEFMEIPLNVDRVKYVEKLLAENKLFPNHVNYRNPKDTRISSNCRREGNESFSLKIRDYFNALELYNKSICYSEENTEDLSLGYANRSAVYFELKLYEACLANIELAKSAHYPDRFMDKILRREEKCNALAADPKDPDDGKNLIANPKLSFPTHKKVPYIADCLDMIESNEFGRYIITNRDLLPGQVLAIEEPYASVILPQVRYQRCAYCLKENHLTLVPCPHCTSAMFCDQNCYEKAYNSFHKYECPIIDYLFGIFNKIQLIALRVVLTAYTSTGNLLRLKEFVSGLRRNECNAFTVDYEKYKTDPFIQYSPIHTLDTNQEKRGVADLFQRAVIVAILKKALMDHTELGMELQADEEKDFLIELLYQHCQTAPTNYHSLHFVEVLKTEPSDGTFASAAYPFCSLLNHSCAPNVLRIYFGTSSTLFVLRPIRAGEQLFDNYGYHHCLHALERRQRELKLQYNFVCQCEACVKNYPLYQGLTMSTSLPNIVSNKDIAHLSRFDKKYAIQSFSKFTKYLAEFDASYPSEQLLEVQESLKMALLIMADAVSLKARNNYN